MEKSYPTKAKMYEALPFLHVFRLGRGECSKEKPAGFYYNFCVPGCIPDSDDYGPFSSELSAVRDAFDKFAD